MLRHFTKARPAFQEAMYYYAAEIIKSEEILKKNQISKVFGIWKKKVSALDLNMMRYIHSKEWDARPNH